MYRAIYTHTVLKMPFCIVFLALCLLGLQGAMAEPAVPSDLRFVYIGPQSGSSFAGVQQGLAEANIQGAFLGQRYHLVVLSPGVWQFAALHDAVAILVASTEAELLRLAAVSATIPVFNLSLTTDRLRRDCYPNILHVIPSDRMYADALAQWQQAHPDSRGGQAIAWHPERRKFAARDLNKRFLARQGRAMDDRSWAAWAAVKMSADALSRMADGDRVGLLHFLVTALNFDGQKGVALDFRKSGQLRQPIWIMEQGRLVGEAPVRGVAVPPGLDSLGWVGQCEK